MTQMLSIFASIILTGFALFLIKRKRTIYHIPMALIMLFLGIQEALDQVVLNIPIDTTSHIRISLILQSLISPLFLYLSLTYSRAGLKSITLRWWGLLILSSLIPIASAIVPTSNLFFSLDIREDGILYLENVGYWIYVAITFYLVLALINIETTYMSLSIVERKTIRFEVIGLLSTLGLLIFYFSQGFLHRLIDMNMVPVRSVILVISMSMIALSMLRGTANVSVKVSRYVVYRSLTLMLLGAYFIILGLSGEAMRYFGISFSRVLMTFLAFALALTMILLIFSEKLKSKVKIFIGMHFFGNKHDYRSQWLNFSQRLSTCRDIREVENIILFTYRDVFGLTSASLYQRSRDDSNFVLSANSMMPAVPKFTPSKALLDYLGAKGRVYRPGDGEYEPSEEETAFVNKTSAFALVPLITATESVDSVVVLGKQVSDEPLIYEDYDLMKTLAKQAAIALLSFRLSAELLETREVTAVARISSFVVHDLKNLASALTLLIENATHYSGDAQFQSDMLLTIQSTTSKMQALIQKLKNVQEKTGLRLELVDMNSIISEIIENLKHLFPDMDIQYEGYSTLAPVDREEIEKVLMNLFLNAKDALAGQGSVRIGLESAGDFVHFWVEDKGEGMTDDFLRDDLFRPFRTTKRNGMGIGLFQCKQIIESHGGHIEVRSKKGWGTSIDVYLPASQKKAMLVGR